MRPDTILTFHEDNTACIAVFRSGHNPTMRALERTHRLSIAYLHARYTRGDVKLEYTPSALMAGDIYTKAFSDKDKWVHVCEMAGGFHPTDLDKILANRAEAASAMFKVTRSTGSQVVDDVAAATSLLPGGGWVSDLPAMLGFKKAWLSTWV